MNKRFTFLCALAIFGAVSLGYAADEQPKAQETIVQQDTINDNPKANESSAVKAYWGKFKDFYGKHKTEIRWISGSIVALYLGHKILYCCSTNYKNWVNGADNQDSEESKLPWRCQ